MEGYEIVLTADRSFMSDYHCLPFLRGLRFASTKILSSSVFFRLVSPPVPAVDGGIALFAPYHTRRTEASLLNSGFDRNQVAVVVPDKIHNFVGPDTKIVSITVRDPLGKIHHYSPLNPLHRETYSALAFKKLIKNPCLRRYGSKIIVEGPGAWQLDDPNVRRRFSIDCVIVGEYPTGIVPSLFKSIIRDEPVPNVVHAEHVAIDDVPLIRGGVTEGLVEVARGCNRGCRFCNVPPLRCRPLRDIISEVEVNIKWDQRNITLRSDDIFNYGAEGVKVNGEAVIQLYESVKGVEGVERVGQCYFNLASLVSQPSLVAKISDVLGVGCRDHPYTTGLTGIESGSPRIVETYLPGKTRPFNPSEWADVVEQGFAICNDNHWVPLGMLILGFPSETEEDVAETITLVERLKPYKSVLIPFTFKAKGILNQAESFDVREMKDYHLELLKAIFNHNIYWGKRLIREQILSMPLLQWLTSFLMPILDREVERAYGILFRETMASRRFDQNQS